MTHQNLCQMHRDVAARFGDCTAMRYRRFGRYQDLTWRNYRRAADWGAAGLIGLGIQPGDRIAVLAENRYEWLVADHAVLSTGAANVPLHAPLSPKQVEYQVGHSGSRGIFVSNQQQADKVVEVLDALPDVEFLVSFDPVAVPSSLKYLTWEGLKHRGCMSATGAGEIARREAALTEESLATIIYTSGTTGNPKGVMLTHGNLYSNAAATLELSRIFPDDTLMSWLPYSHIYARTVDHYLMTLAAGTVALAASVDTLIADLADIRPNWLTSVPRFYEKVWTGVEQLEPEERKQALADIFGPNIRQLCSGGAPLPRHVCEGVFSAGIPLLEGYGLTESSPVISLNSIDEWKIGTVGKPISGVEVKIADDGEILTKGPHVMPRYWKNTAATAETIVDGWLHTGDVGMLDGEGFLSITDRKKDLIVTSSGKNVAPSELERLLVSDPCIDQAVVYGDGKNFITAIIVPNFENLQNKTATKQPINQMDGTFIQDESVQRFYGERIAALMEAVSRPEQVRKFLVLARAFQVDADELTATLKVRRRHIIEKYQAELDALYEEP